MKPKQLTVETRLLTLLLDNGPQLQKALIIDAGVCKRSVELRLSLMEAAGLVQKGKDGKRNVWRIGSRVREWAERQG